jgi:geranylgeranyl diphosphate synthase, type II
VHDDIEDADRRATASRPLHAEHGVPVALNVGDLLIGEGYRLLASCDAPPAMRAEIVRIAADGHRQLCLGQGAELAWAAHPRPLAANDVLDIFRRKTAPAFEVALRLGAAFAGAPPEVHDTLRALQRGARHRLPDPRRRGRPRRGEAPDDLRALRPSLPLAVALERAKGDRKAVAMRAWTRSLEPGDAEALHALMTELAVADRCRTMLEMYKEQAIRTLPELQHASLKGLLRRVVGKIFRVEIKGWCSEFEARNAAGGAPRAAAAG